jgi:hypothetical protein
MRNLHNTVSRESTHNNTINKAELMHSAERDAVHILILHHAALTPFQDLDI